MPILPRGGRCSSYYNAACRNCVIDIGPFVRFAVIACVTIARAAMLLL